MPPAGLTGSTPPQRVSPSGDCEGPGRCCSTWEAGALVRVPSVASRRRCRRPARRGTSGAGGGAGRFGLPAGTEAAGAACWADRVGPTPGGAGVRPPGGLRAVVQ
jgi:hypothetical protein